MPSEQVEIVTLSQLVAKNHPYKELLELVDFKGLSKTLKEIKKNQETGRKGYTVEQCLKMLVLQFMENLSDREMERFIRENLAGKLFCNFSILEKTPDHNLFYRIRQRIGINKLGKLFNKVQDQLKHQGLIREMFTFVDASHLISKVNIWEDRDRLIEKGLKTFDNKVLKKVEKKQNSINNKINDRKNKNNKNKKVKRKLQIKIIKADTQARMGCKGKNKFWFGYKRHASVDMQSGLINKVAITPANVPDGKAVKHILPNSGAILGDKGYCIKSSIREIKKKGLHDMTIKKNNMKGKNKEKDRWISSLRSTYERVFSKMPRRVKYRGIAKNQFAFFMDALSFNFKRLIKLNEQDYINVQPLCFST